MVQYEPALRVVSQSAFGVGVLVLLFVLTACGSSGASSGDRVGQPVGDLFAIVDPSDPRFAQRQFDQTVETYEATRACMAELGFDYEVPAPLAAGSGRLEPETITGYGIVDAVRMNIELVNTIRLNNPNTSVSPERTEAEQLAWNQALWGVDDPSALSPEDDTIVPAGCWGEAIVEHVGSQELIFSLSREARELDSRYEADPEVVAIHEEWASCMAEQGFLFQTPDQARNSISAGVGEINRRAMTTQGPLELSEPEQDRLQDLQEQEERVADADAACSVAIESRLSEIRSRYDAEFFEEHPDLVDL